MQNNAWERVSYYQRADWQVRGHGPSEPSPVITHNSIYKMKYLKKVI